MILMVYIFDCGFCCFRETDEVLDLPVDPNEPLYCICQQVSYGEMIACDNEDVKFIFFLIPSFDIAIQSQYLWRLYILV